jgi:hypothetical protein
MVHFRQAGKQFPQHGGSNLAPSTAAMSQGGQAILPGGVIFFLHSNLMLRLSGPHDLFTYRERSRI